MSDKQRHERERAARGPSAERRRVRLPQFVLAEPIGLGDVVKRVTTWAGVQPCGGCGRRANRLNDWVRLEPRNTLEPPSAMGGRDE
jgi:hypothetical protein